MFIPMDLEILPSYNSDPYLAQWVTVFQIFGHKTEQLFWMASVDSHIFMTVTYKWSESPVETGLVSPRRIWEGPRAYELSTAGYESLGTHNSIIDNCLNCVHKVSDRFAGSGRN